MNEETKKVLSEAEHLSALMKSDGWMIAKKRLLEKMAEYGNIITIEETDPVKLMQLIGANQQAIKLVITWFKEIENSIDLAKEFKEGLKEDLNKMIVTLKED